MPVPIIKGSQAYTSRAFFSCYPTLHKQFYPRFMDLRSGMLAWAIWPLFQASET